MQTRTTQDWLSALEAADIPAMPLHTPDSLVDDKHLQASGFFKEVDHPSEGKLTLMNPATSWSETPLSIRHLPPTLGQDTAAVLRAIGYTDTQLEALNAKNPLRS